MLVPCFFSLDNLVFLFIAGLRLSRCFPDILVLVLLDKDWKENALEKNYEEPEVHHVDYDFKHLIVPVPHQVILILKRFVSQSVL